MAIQFFGFSFGNKKEELKNIPVSPEADFADGSTIIEAGASAQGYAIDMDIDLKSDIDFIKKYREISSHAEVEIALDDIVNEGISEDESGQIIKIDLDFVQDVSVATKKKIVDEFNTVLYLLNLKNIFFYLTKHLYFCVLALSALV